MAPAPLASTEHLEQQDLGPDFADLIPAFMEVVDSIGFQPGPDSPLFEICKDDRLISGAAPLLQKLQSTKNLGECRIAQATKASLQNPTGTLYIIVPRASATATISGKPVKVGQSTYLKQMVTLFPEFVCLLIVSMISRHGPRMVAVQIVWQCLFDALEQLSDIHLNTS